MSNDSEYIYNMLDHVKATATQNDPISILKTIDDYCWKHWMMHVGDRKGLILDNEVEKKQPLNVLELGTYCGYSAIRMANLMPENGHIYSLEINEQYAEIAREIIEFAGMTNKITIVMGTLSDKLDELKAKGITYFDLVFLDHWKDQYLSDFKLLESNNMIPQNSVIVADNILYPGAPDYLAYIQASSDKYHNTGYDQMLEYVDNIKDQIWVSIVQ
jgi:catechol O-methyltransferase